MALAAHPINPLAPAVLILVAVLMAAGDTAGQLAANERLFRLATGPGVLAFQSHFVVHNVGAYAGGVAASSMIMLLGGYPAFAILFVGRRDWAASPRRASPRSRSPARIAVRRRPTRLRPEPRRAGIAFA